MTVRDGTVSLLPCPFCGSTDTRLGRQGKYGDGDHVVHCDVCRIEGPEGNSSAEAIAAWNCRSVPSEPVAWRVKLIMGRDEEDGGDYWKTTIVTNPEFVRELDPVLNEIIPLYPSPPSKEVTPAMVEAGDLSRALSALDAAGYAMVPKLELNLMKATLSCVHRWAIEKKGNGSTAEERLSVIANHPGITGFPFLEQS